MTTQRFLLTIFYLQILISSPIILGQTTNTTNFTSPQRYQIGGIEVKGTKYLDPNVLINLSGLSVGETITIPGEDIGNGIRALWKQGLFSDIKIYATRFVNDVVFLQFELKERERLSKYAFKGIPKGDEDDLRDKIGLVRGKIVDDDLLSKTQGIILDHYREKGYFNANLNTSIQPDTLFTNSVILLLNIERGEKVHIGNIYFSGNNTAASRKLKKQMKDTKERSRLFPHKPKEVTANALKSNPFNYLGNFSIGDALNYIDDNIFRFRLFSSSKYNQDEYQKDKQAVIDYYNNLGYRDAAITYDTIYSINDRTIDIKINVDEGNPYYFRNITFRGNNKYPSELLSQILGIKKGDKYSQSELQTRIFQDPNANDISSLYMDDGYLFFQVTPIEKAVEGDSIDLDINIYEGTQATIDKVIISGNTKTNEHVIRREIRSYPGTKFSRSDIIRTTREIANLGYFDPEKTEVNPMPNPSKGTVDIEYKVSEKPADQLELSAGWGGTGVIGTVGVSFNNFSARNLFKKEAWNPIPSGDGQRLSFRLQSTGKAFQSINASFTEPWLGGKKPNALTISAYTSRIFQDYTGTTNDRLRYIIGGSVGIGRRLRWPDDNFTLQNEINYQFFNLKNSNDFTVSNGVVHNLSFRTTLARYSLDQPIYPRSGSNFSLTLALTAPYSLLNERNYSDLPTNEKYKFAEYHKWKLKAEWFTPIVGNLVLRTAAKMGIVGYYNSDIGFPILEKFEIGGDGLGLGGANFLYGKDIYALRGYETEQVTVPIAGSTLREGDPIMSKYTVELRYPLTLNPSSTIYVQAFVEGGNSWKSFRSFNPFDIKRTAGLGARIYLPMFGILGFDYGIGFDKILNTNNSDPTATSNKRTLGEFIRDYGRFSVVLGFDPE